jgi:hypothetical protein
MNQVGEVLTAQANVSAGTPVAYVWRWWDGHVDVTPGTLVQRALNVGGTLDYSLLAVDELGQSQQQAGTVVVNAPPLISNVSLSVNDAPAPYSGVLTVTMDDPEHAGPIVADLDGVTAIIAAPPGVANIPYTVTQSRVARLAGTDADGGIAAVDVDLRVTASPDIEFTGAAVSPAVGRIGPGQFVTLGVVAQARSGEPITAIQWDLAAEDGWAAPVSASPAPTALGDAAYQATLVKDVSAETPGAKVARVTATTGAVTGQLAISVRLVANRPPVISAISMGSVEAGRVVEVAGTASDPDGDPLSYGWSFTQPLASRLGNPVNVTATGPIVAGVLTVTDSLGATATLAIPPALITSPLVAQGVVGQPFTYQISAMGQPPMAFTAAGLPPGLGIVGDVISGMPLESGVALVTLGASGAGGSASASLTLEVSLAPSPPPAPANLAVNGMAAAPFYSHNQDLVITWTVINDNINLEQPSSVLEFRDVSGAVRLTAPVAKGVANYTLTAAALQAAFGGEPTLSVRALETRAGVLSAYYQELTVTRV